MAVFPQGLTNIDSRCNVGERRVLHAIKRHLEDDYLVWHDVPIGPRARQPDFVILSPRWGLLLLEVKAWKPSSLGAATTDRIELQTPRGTVVEPNPLRQVRDYAMELVGVMQGDAALVHDRGNFAGKLLFPYGWGVALVGLRSADITDRQSFDAIFPPNRLLLRDDVDADMGDALDAAAFQRKLWGMFTVHYPYTLSLPQRDRIRWHLFPEVRLGRQQALDFAPSQSQGLPAIRLPDLIEVMDLQQEQVARSLGEGHRVIHGPAGSGKTMILVFRAEQLAAAARADKPILVLCYNRSLAGHIESMLRRRSIDERVQVKTFHGWCEDLVRSYQIDAPRDRQAPDYFKRLAEVASRAVESGRVPAGQYTALLVDEAHDFEDAWLAMATRMVDPATRSLLVLYDDAQSIYQKQRRKFNFRSVGIEAQGRSRVLKINYRNTAEVLALALTCAQQLLHGEDAVDEDSVPTVRPESAGRRGSMPVLIEARSPDQEVALVVERIDQARAEGLGLRDIAILFRARDAMLPFENALRRHGIDFQSMSRQAIKRFDWDANAVKLLTLHSAKGLEFPIVFIAGLHAMPMRSLPVEDEVRLLYVGMTRATHRLVLSACAGSPIVDRVRESLDRIGRQFAALPEAPAP